MTFNKTREGEGAGIIALTSNGTEVRFFDSLVPDPRKLINLVILGQSVQNVCQLLLKWHKSELKDRLGLHGQNPC